MRVDERSELADGKLERAAGVEVEGEEVRWVFFQEKTRQDASSTTEGGFAGGGLELAGAPCVLRRCSRRCAGPSMPS